MQMPSRFHISFVIMALAALSAVHANSQTFATTGSLPLPLICPTATPLQNGMILIVGERCKWTDYVCRDLQSQHERPGLRAHNRTNKRSARLFQHCDLTK